MWRSGRRCLPRRFRYVLQTSDSDQGQEQVRCVSYVVVSLTFWSTFSEINRKLKQAKMAQREQTEAERLAKIHPFALAFDPPASTALTPSAPAAPSSSSMPAPKTQSAALPLPPSVFAPAVLRLLNRY